MGVLGSSYDDSESTGVAATVDQNVLADDIARLRAAQESTSLAELGGAAEAARGVRAHLSLAQFLDRLPCGFRSRFEIAAQPIGVEGAGKQVVDRHVVPRNLARKTRDKAGQAAARAIGQAENVDRRLDRQRGDIHD